MERGGGVTVEAKKCPPAPPNLPAIASGLALKLRLLQRAAKSPAAKCLNKKSAVNYSTVKKDAHMLLNRVRERALSACVFSPALF